MIFIYLMAANVILYILILMPRGRLTDNYDVFIATDPKRIVRRTQGFPQCGRRHLEQCIPLRMPGPPPIVNARPLSRVPLVPP